MEAEVLAQRSTVSLADERQNGSQLRDPRGCNRGGNRGVARIRRSGGCRGVRDVREGPGDGGEVRLELFQALRAHRSGKGLLGVGHRGRLVVLVVGVHIVFSLVSREWTVRGGFDVLGPHQRGGRGRLDRLGQPRRRLSHPRLNLSRRGELGVNNRFYRSSSQTFFRGRLRGRERPLRERVRGSDRVEQQRTKRLPPGERRGSLDDGRRGLDRVD